MECVDAVDVDMLMLINLVDTMNVTMLLLNITICQSWIERLCDGEMCKFNILCVGPGLDAWPGLTARTLYCWSAEYEQGRISHPPTSL